MAPLRGEGHVQTVVPPYPISRVEDTADVRFNNNYAGEFTKKNNSNTVQWEQNKLYILGDCDGCTPLLLDLDRDGFEFGDSGVGVEFDILANGQPKLLQWVAVGTDDGLLARDIDSSGSIENGSELFGVGTAILATGEKATNGYQALAQFDTQEHGGNGDDRITPLDFVWPELKLWVDANADGASQDGEIETLDHHRILGISLNARRANRHDDAGNYIPYWSWVAIDAEKGPKRLRMVDVYFKVIE